MARLNALVIAGATVALVVVAALLHRRESGAGPGETVEIIPSAPIDLVSGVNSAGDVTPSERLHAELAKLAASPAGAALRDRMRQEDEPALDALVARYDASASAEERRQVVKEFGARHPRYAKLVGGTRYIAFVDRVVRAGDTESACEALISMHGMSQPEAVNLLASHMESSQPRVAFYATEGLAWVAGEEGPRARTLLVGALDAPSDDIREIAALSLGTSARGDDTTPAVLGRLRDEPVRRVRKALVHALFRSDAAGAAQSIEDLAASLDAPLASDLRELARAAR